LTGMTLIVKTVSRILSPIILIAGAYIVVHGHLTPGGGFQGGVILACGVILLIFAFGLQSTEEKVSLDFSNKLKSLSMLFIIIVGLTGLAFGFWFFRSVGAFPFYYWVPGIPGEIPSAGSLPLYNVGEGIHVAVAFIIIFYSLTRLARREGEE